jgi:hypothetical protein
MTLQEMRDAVTELGQHVGLDLHLDTWSPGDGWTRYRIERHHPNTTGTSRYTTNYRRAEMIAYLRGAGDAAEKHQRVM